MWGKIIIPMYRLWLHGLYGLYGPWCPLSAKRPINLISLSLSLLYSRASYEISVGRIWKKFDLCEDTALYHLLLSGEFVAQFKFTVLLMPNGPMRITGLPFDADLFTSEHSVEDEELKVSKFKCQYSYQGINASEFSSFYVISGIMP